MIIIFLDIDGVLNSIARGELDKDAISYLNQFINDCKKMGVEVGVVISSDWRRHISIYQLKEMFERYSFSEHIVGKTSDTDPGDNGPDNFRGIRIYAWLAAHTEWNIHKVVIFDDNLYDILQILPDYFVHVTGGVLRPEDIKKAEDILRDKSFMPDSEQKASKVNSGIIELAKNGQLEKITELLQSEPEALEQQDACGHTALMWSVIKRHSAVANYLIEQKADHSVVTQAPRHIHDQRTALHWAAINGDAEIVLKLLQAGADPRARTTHNDDQAIHSAAKKKHGPVVETLVKFDRGLLDEKDRYQQTALIWAAAKKDMAVVQYLIGQGADLSAETRLERPWHADEEECDGYTALHYAVNVNSADCVKALVEEKASLEQNNAQLSPVHLAAQKGLVPLLKYFLSHDATLLHQKNSQNQTLLETALLAQQAETLTFLLGAHGDLVAKQHASLLPLAFTLSKNETEIVALLLDKNIILVTAGYQYCSQKAVTQAEKRVAAAQYVKKVIEHCFDPLKLIQVLLDIFEMEKRQPLLIAIEHRPRKIRLTCPRSFAIEVSRVWTNLTDLACEKILKMTKAQPQYLDNEQIRAFLASHTSRRLRWFAGKYLERYELLPTQNRIAQHQVAHGNR